MKTLKIQSLSSEYVDRDELLLHASFQILKDFIEKEKPATYFNFDYDTNIWNEILYLYNWWTNVRPNRIDLLRDPTMEIPPIEYITSPNHTVIKYFNDKKYKKYYDSIKEQPKLDSKYEKEDQRNLRRLIKVRMHLWT